MGGETFRKWDTKNAHEGLSPRGRGNHESDVAFAAPCGSIPAWAGKPPGIDSDTIQPVVYPRVGGETALPPCQPATGTGLSPRGRGNRSRCECRQYRPGSIPAWAGKPSSAPHSVPPTTVYPRVGGETHSHLMDHHLGEGLSPRGRGNPAAAVRLPAELGSIPAWAGKPGQDRRVECRQQVYPRVGGETHSHLMDHHLGEGLSPRGRGNPAAAVRLPAELGSIPAWAGKPGQDRRVECRQQVYPRVGGETTAPRGSCVITPGLSPRGRGNPPARRAFVRSSGSIPAWAGKPRESLRRNWRQRVYPRVGGETWP